MLPDRPHDLSAPAEASPTPDQSILGRLLQQRPLVRVLATFLNTSTPLFSPLHVKSFAVVYKCECDFTSNPGG